jgi:hypothetical protein
MKLNQNTFFTIQPIGDGFKTKSACHIFYGDTTALEEAIDTTNLSPEAFEEILKEKVEFGLTLNRKTITNNEDRDLPVDVVEAHKYVHYQHDSF